MPGSPHLQGPPYFTWGSGRSLKLVDDKAGIPRMRSRPAAIEV
jgi:hypothetical protein